MYIVQSDYSIKSMQNFDIWRGAKQKIYLWGDFQYLQGRDKKTGQQKEHIGFRQIYLPSIVTLLACGNQHLILYTSSNKLFGLGSNRSGQLALGTQKLQIRNSPIQLPIPTACQIKQISCGSHHTLMIDQDNNVHGCGQGQYGAVGAGIKTNCFEWTIVAVGLVKVACGSRHSIGINEHGRVYGWGDSSQGQLGLTSNPVNRYYRPTSLEILGDVTDITAANNISIFVTENGVVGCGGNHLGQLGLGHKNPVYSPTQILLKNLEVNRIFAGNYTVTMTKDQNLYFTGTGAFGELLFPVKVPIKNVEDVFIGDTYGFAKDTEGKIYGWGSNINGELCEDSSIRGLSKPTELSSLQGFNPICCGRNFVVGLSSSSIVKTLDDTSFLSNTLEVQPDKELTELRKENKILKQMIKQLQKSSDQEDIKSKYINLTEQYMALKSKQTDLQIDISQLQLKLRDQKVQSTKLQNQNMILSQIVKDFRKTFHSSKELQFRQLEPLLEVYEKKYDSLKSQLSNYQQKLNTAKRQYLLILDSFENHEFFRQFFGGRRNGDYYMKKTILKQAPAEQLRNVFYSLTVHADKLRGIIESLYTIDD